MKGICIGEVVTSHISMFTDLIPVPDFTDTISVLADFSPLGSLFGSTDENEPVEIFPGPYAPVVLINFDNFKANGSFPRYPEDKSLTTTFDKVDRSTSIIIYVSHRWLRPTPDNEGWDGRPHPDSPNGVIFDLCVEGIEKLLKTLAPGMPRCYLWIDYSCLNQKNPSTDLIRIDKIIECSDCLFTPLYDDKARATAFESRDLYEDYRAKSWNEGPAAYLNRAWCRLEMLYAANMPLIPEEDESRTRLAKFRGGLALSLSNSRRAHIIYGSNESKMERPPLVLPTLQNSQFDVFNPVQGNFSNSADVETIAILTEKLKLVMKPIIAAYDGPRVDGRRHGHGTNTYVSGATYTGAWKDGKKHGKGVYRYPNGDVCEGTWENDNIHGRAVYYYSDGDVYDGEFEKGKMHGRGVYTYSYGDVYEGSYRAGHRVGVGIYRYRNGDVYRGEYRDHQRVGKSVYQFANGDSYEGEWKDDIMHGNGVYKYKNGDRFEGNYEEGVKHGKGKLTFKSGNCIEGPFSGDVCHGEGWFYFANGDVYQGLFVKGKREGYGVWTYVNGDIYEGETLEVRFNYFRDILLFFPGLHYPVPT